MSEERFQSPLETSEDNLRRIRSVHRRRLLDRLTDGGDTVSNLARATGLRIPHASAELRRMRNDGLISSDEEAGSRGARINLTRLGWESIRSDELSRARDVLPLPNQSNQYCLLARDGSNLLLGMLTANKSPLILIPDRPVPVSNIDGNSSGSEGVSWTWAVLRERSPRWFDLSSLKMLESPPPNNDPENISSYAGGNSSIGIVRARLVDSSRPIALAPGMWFESPSTGIQPLLPEASHHRGNWSLGNCHEQAPDIRPKHPIVAIMDERLPRSMLLRTARINSMVIADLGGLDVTSDPYPISCLESWIVRAHPRLTESERRRRLTSLRERILTTRRVKTEESTWRRFRKDWGDSDFTNEEASIRILDNRGLGNAAITSLIEWSVSTEDRPALVLEINKTIPDDLLTTVIAHPMLRLIIASDHYKQFSIFDELIVDPLRPLPWLRLKTRGGRDIPLRLSEPLASADIIISEELQNLDPWMILNKDINHSKISQDSDNSMLSSAISQYPEGNEDWANMLEASYPIAAWIASPLRTRWHRWQRLRDRLNSEWLALMDLRYIPLERLAEIVDEATEEVQEKFSTQLRSMIRDNSQVALRARPSTDPSQATIGDSWIASQLLANAAWLPDDMHSDLLHWALEAWLVNPPIDSVNSLTSIQWLYKLGKIDQESYDPILQGILRRSRDLSIEHDLHVWSLLVSALLDNRNLAINELEAVITRLPLDWWAPLSPKLLQYLLTEESTFEWLTTNPIPWAAVIFRPKGEASLAPGLVDVIHPGFSLSLRNSLSRRLRPRYERGTLPEGASPLLDILDSLDTLVSNEPPKTGRTHPLIGWLVRPIDRWPNLSNSMIMQGDPFIAERLVLRISAHNENLESEIELI